MSRDGRSGFSMGFRGASSRALAAAGPSSQPSSSSSQRKAPLSRADAFGDEDDDDDDNYLRGRHGPHSSSSNGKSGRNGQDRERLTGYSRSGAEYNGQPSSRVSTKAAPLVIPKQADTDWMQERKRRLGLDKLRNEVESLTGHTSRREGATSGTHSDRINDAGQKVGLEIRRKDASVDAMDTDMSARDETPSLSQAAESPPSRPVDKSDEQGDDDEESRARRLLLSAHASGLGGNGHNRAAIIAPMSEDEALRRDAETRPDEPTLDDYARMPVEDFGAALLRGMGWKEGMGAGKNRQGPASAPELKKRAALLGLGAKECQRPSEDGGRGSRDVQKHHQYRPERRYVPLVRRERELDTSRDHGPRERADDRHHSSRPRSRSPSLHSRRGQDRDDYRRHRDVDDRYERRRREELDRDRESHRRSGHR